MDDKRFFASNGILAEPHMVVAEWEEQTLPGPFDDRQGTIVMTEEVPIQWVHETQSTVVFKHGGNVVSVRSSYSDFYGFGKSIQHAMVSMKESMEYFAAGPESTLVMEVVTDIISIATQGLPAQHDPIMNEYPTGKRFGDTIYRRYPKQIRFYGVVDYDGKPCDHPVGLLSQKRMHSRQTVLNSKMSLDEMEQAAQDAIERLNDQDYLDSLEPLTLVIVHAENFD